MGPNESLMLQTFRAEVDKKTPFALARLQVIENLRCLNVSKFSEGFEFNNDRVVTKRVRSIRRPKFSSLVKNWHLGLSAEGNLPIGELKFESLPRGF